MSRGIHDLPRCGAATSSGGRCGQVAGWGTDHLGFGACKAHCGATPSGRQGAAFAMARAHVASLAQPQPIEPHEALDLALALTRAEVEYFTAKIEELQDQDAAGPVVSTHTRPRNLGKDGEDPSETITETRRAAPELHIWIRARAQAIDRLARYAKLAADAGVSERRVRVQERLGEQVEAVLRASSAAVFALLRERATDPRMVAVLDEVERTEVPRIVRAELLAAVDAEGPAGG